MRKLFDTLQPFYYYSPPVPEHLTSRQDHVKSAALEAHEECAETSLVTCLGQSTWSEVSQGGKGSQLESHDFTKVSFSAHVVAPLISLGCFCLLATPKLPKDRSLNISETWMSSLARCAVEHTCGQNTRETGRQPIGFAGNAMLTPD